MSGQGNAVLWWSIALFAAAAYELIAMLPASVVHSALTRTLGVRAVHRFDFKSTLHSLIVGTAAAAVAIMDAASLDIKDPARMYACVPASGRLSWALPAIEAGYAVGELFTMLPQRNWQYVVHGVLVLALLLGLSVFDMLQYTARLLVIHVSTVFLNLRGLDLGARRNASVDIAFASSFFLLRLLVLPVWWLQFLAHGYSTDVLRMSACVTPSGYAWVVVGGVLLHGLNLYWGVLIALKLYEKLVKRGTLHREQPEKNG